MLVAATLAGCMGSEDSGQPRQPPSAGARIGAPLQLVDCTDWREATPRERMGTVRALRRFAGGRTGSPGGRGRVLDDDRAYEMFENYCKNDFARGFKLYKLYTRAAAFSRRR